MTPPPDLTPREIVAALDQHIVGQAAAKRVVAIALRNRYRRQRVPEAMRDEIIPKNILMIGPTGVGKTEIARRLARLAQAPMVKVEATKFTEVGYVGRDVESMVRDLTEHSVQLVQAEQMERIAPQAREAALDDLAERLVPAPGSHQAPFAQVGALFGQPPPTAQPGDDDWRTRRRTVREQLAQGDLDGERVEIEVEEQRAPFVQVFGPGGLEEVGMDLENMLGRMMPGRSTKRRVTVREAKDILAGQHARRMVDTAQATAEAIERVEQRGILFIDELDKVTGGGTTSGPDVSREGVQRDLLPIVEGTTVITKYGPVRTDHILFIAAGAFHASKPSDLIPELQGRLPLRVELDSLSEDDFFRILTEPKNALTKQYTALLATEGVTLEFRDDGVREVARLAAQINRQGQDIGARRLHTVMERLLDEVSFAAPDISPASVTITAAYVRERVAALAEDVDLSKYVL